MAKKRACRYCGCTEERACVQGVRAWRTEHAHAETCFWISSNVCSACDVKPGDLWADRDWRMGTVGAGRAARPASNASDAERIDYMPRRVRIFEVSLASVWAETVKGKRARLLKSDRTRFIKSFDLWSTKGIFPARPPSGQPREWWGKG